MIATNVIKQFTGRINFIKPFSTSTQSYFFGTTYLLNQGQ